MSFQLVAAKSSVLRLVGVMTVAAAALVSVSATSEPTIRAQSAQRAAPPKVRLPDEAAGIDGIVGALISVYDQFDVVALAKDFWGVIGHDAHRSPEAGCLGFMSG